MSLLSHRALLILIALCILAARDGAASWGFPAPDLRVEGSQLDEDAIFARIDSLEARLDDLGGEALADAYSRLAELYIATDMRKHRRHALELIDEAVELDPENARLYRLWAGLAEQMGYDSAARDRIDDALETGPIDVEALLVLGGLELRLGLRHLSDDRLRAARSVFRAAIDLDSTRADVWHGMAASALALGEYRATRRAARSLARMRPVEGLLLEAVAQLRLGEEDLAWARFAEVLERISAPEQSVFFQGQGFLGSGDLEVIAERVIPRPDAFAALRAQGEDPQPGDEVDWDIALRDPGIRERVLREWWAFYDERPAQIFSTGELEYWARLVEADVLFGKPTLQIRGWNTPPGDTWVRWGRPTSTWYDPGGGGSTSRLDAMGAAGIRFEPEHYLPPNAPPVWVWTYRWPGTWISFLFTDVSRSARWTPSESSRRTLADLNDRVPIRLPRRDQVRAFQLAVSAVSFPRPGEDALVETYISLEPTAGVLEGATEEQADRLMFADRDTIAIVEWTVRDEEGEQIDNLRRVVGRRSRRSALLSGLGRKAPAMGEDPCLAVIPARLAAGRYRIGLEVVEPVTGARSSESFALEVPGPEPGDLLELSGLQLATAFDRWSPGLQIPAEFVKYTRAILPAPDATVMPGSGVLGVYFEVRNLARGADGLSSFDARYTVYRSLRETRDLAFRDDPDVDGLELVAPASLIFVDESSGVSPEGLVVKGIELDVGGLQAGDYVLIVSIHDRIAGYTASRASVFRIRG